VRTLRQEEIDPRYRNVDPKFIEVIENEILSEVSLCSAFESRVPGCRRDSLPAACPCVELTPRDCAMAAARQCANVDWEDIAGLKFAKKSVEEMVILPIVRCTHRDTHKGEGGRKLADIYACVMDAERASHIHQDMNGGGGGGRRGGN
jgi:hypothetical protein